MAGKLSSKDATGRTVQLSRVRLSFASSLQVAEVPKKAEPGTKPTHGANILLEKDGPYAADYESNVAAVQEALRNAGKEFKRPEDWWETLFTDDPKTCAFRKGTRFKNAEGKIYEGYENANVIAGKGPKGGKEGSRPKFYDRAKRQLREQADQEMIKNGRVFELSEINEIFYNGTYCDVILSFYGTDKGGTARISCSIESIRSYQDGPRMGGGGVQVDADDFDDFEGEDDGFEAAPPAAEKPKSRALDL